MEETYNQQYTEYNYQPPVKPKKKSTLIIVIVAIVAVLAILVGIVVGVLTLNGPKHIAEKVIEASIYNDIHTMSSLSSFDMIEAILGDMDEEEYFELVSDEYGEDITSWKELSKIRREEQEEELEDEYGEYKITIEATKVKDLSSKRLESDYSYSLRQAEDYGFDTDEISDAKVVTVKVKLKGEDDTERLTYEVILVRVGLSWKLLDWDDIS